MTQVTNPDPIRTPHRTSQQFPHNNFTSHSDLAFNFNQITSQPNLEIIQINLGKTKAATDILEETADVYQPDFFLVQKPHVSKERIQGIPKSWNVQSSTSMKATIFTPKTSHKTTLLAIKSNTVAIKVQSATGPITLISSYSSPYSNLGETLQEITDIITSLRGEKIIICADLNGHHNLWGYKNKNTRGETILDFILANSLFLINKSGAPPTFHTPRAEGWPDLTLCTQELINTVDSWDVTKGKPNERLQRKLIYKKERSKYISTIRRDKVSGWKNFCTKASNTYGKQYKAAFRKSITPSQLVALENEDPKGGQLAAANNILRQLYPDPPANNTPTTLQPATDNDPPFTESEVSDIIRHLPKGKAPGYDGIDNIVVQQINKKFPSLLLSLFNRCLTLGLYPDPFKIGNIVLFLKPGKIYNEVSSYRPIALLPSIAKVLEKLMTRRLVYHLERS
ncbi:hypothetical protein AVEN_124525-1 [Araneus ventricosus]|uniref:Endonuclease/exonuclease/phosphatase domain-containing protein n=1 Tax=Araneus ventricosus TaxID=182803 RepID=A0A4Y2X1U7_ARAVE|nr:hypothetical protein AVEN_124525-1 [Araneus ventricosus]